MPVNNMGSYSGRGTRVATNGSVREDNTVTRALNGQAHAKVPKATPPKTTGSAPNFQKSGNGNHTGESR